MTHRTRNILFITLFILFLIIAPITVFYSLGWRFDWTTKKIVQTGVFYFKVWPKNAQIYINGEFKKKTDIFFSSVNIDNLLPGQYQIEIKKDGYYDWRKTLEIKKKEVTEGRNIVLIPKNPNFNLLAEQVKDFFFFPDGKKVILKEEENEGWSLKLFDLNKNIKSHLIDETNISKEEVEIIDLKFSPDSKDILLKLGLKENIYYYILETDSSPAKLTKIDFLDSADQIYFHPADSRKLFISQKTALNEIDLENREILPPLIEDIVAFSINGDNIYYLDSSGSFFKTDFSAQKKEKLNIEPFSLKKETLYEIIISASKIFIKENEILYVFDENQKSFKKLFEPVKNLKLSPDSKKIVYFNDYEIYILFLEKQYDQPTKEANDQLFITRFSEKINDIFWYTDYYLIFNLGDKIKVMEIDERDKININDLAGFKEPKIFFANKKLYLLSEEKLYVSSDLTP
jgi:WD40 repeat protein